MTLFLIFLGNIVALRNKNDFKLEEEGVVTGLGISEITDGTRSKNCCGFKRHWSCISMPVQDLKRPLGQGKSYFLGLICE